MRGIGVVLGVLAVSLLAAPPAAAGGSAEVGQPAPAFTKTLLSGGEVSLSDYLGKVVVIYLFGYA